ncbi:glycerol kinase [Aquabacterium lacunae]|uniref:Glycerol kinase n=1 Tax=Aquabacterium lacunae TaxID=2528630 RepID=A0A4V2JFN8_9BURK|nr:glycerol kinase GlpK [Aquabacterium lacunae]TBO30070.1 glycerol kinase [Aquabacterium lacunae]
MAHLLALDQGTSSSRAIVFNAQGQPVTVAQREFTQHFPRPGWVEHDATEIWHTQLAVAREALKQAGLSAHQVHAIGITNQRETTVLWERATGRPLGHAIVWQDRRGEALCQRLREAGHAELIRQRTGLVVDAYFSATKLAWMLEHIPGARQRAQSGELAFGTIDSWLLWQLTGGTTAAGAVHATDVSNASRTMLFNIERQCWDDELLALFDIPRSLLPEVQASAHRFGQTSADVLGAPITIGALAGDQQSALFGQACFTPGLVKNTYGTGCFMLMHTGAQRCPSQNGLITTLAATPLAPALGTPAFAQEGSVFIGGAVVQWLRDGLQAIEGSHQVEQLALNVPDAGGVFFVPSFTGMGAPYWKPHATGAILGLTRGTTVAHIARAALESIAFQSAALLQAMGQDLAAAGGQPVSELRVDGGACRNDLLMQFQADLLGIPVVRPAVTETTALGAAYLAGIATGLYAGTDELSALWRAERRFLPTLPREEAAQKMAAWHAAVTRVVA